MVKDGSKVSNSNNQYIGNIHYLIVMRDYLIKKNKLNINMLNNINIANRQTPGFVLPIEGHIQAMVYALLTNQRPWYLIRPHLKVIDILFNNYDPNAIYTRLGVDPDYYIKGLKNLKCGNRAVNYQFCAENLKYNIELFRSIEKEYGSIDSFMVPKASYNMFALYDAQYSSIINKISGYNSKYKFRGFGKAIAAEYLRNIGVPDVKPDTHIRRFYSSDRMGNINNQAGIATINQAIADITSAAQNAGMTRNEADNIIWSYCAKGFGEICTSNPNCSKCVISSLCKHISAVVKSNGVSKNNP